MRPLASMLIQQVGCQDVGRVRGVGCGSDSLTLNPKTLNPKQGRLESGMYVTSSLAADGFAPELCRELSGSCAGLMCTHLQRSEGSQVETLHPNPKS